MFTRSEAISITEENLNSDGEDPIVKIYVDATLEYDFGWVFFYNSEKYMSTGDWDDMLVGNAPIIFERETGRMIETGTADPIDSYIEAYLSCGDPYGQPTRSVHISGYTSGASAIIGIKILRKYDRMLSLVDAKQQLEMVLSGGSVMLKTDSAHDAVDAVSELRNGRFLADLLYETSAT